MKRLPMYRLFMCLCIFCLSSVGTINAQERYATYDLNGDGIIDDVDMKLLSCKILGRNSIADSQCDINSDGGVNVDDIVAVMDAALQFSRHDVIDLGLPSGLKWATCNIGAERTEDYGDYFAWGATVGFVEGAPDVYWDSWKNYIWGKGDYNLITKYCNNYRYAYRGICDNKLTLEPEDDAAHVKWGGDWRMPTATEAEELVNYCTKEKVTLNGVDGYQFTSKKTGKSIFLPIAGFWESTAHDQGKRLIYWTSSLYSQPDFAYSIYGTSVNIWSRPDGLAIRPVCSLPTIVPPTSNQTSGKVMANITQRGISIAMKNETPFMAFQMDVYVPDGIRISPAEANKSITAESGIIIDSEMISSNVMRVLLYHNEGQSIVGGNDELFSIDFSNAPQVPGTIEIKGIRLVNADDHSGVWLRDVKADIPDEIVSCTDVSGYENIIYVNPVEANSGSEVTLSIRMKNSKNVSGFQMNVCLPEGIEIKTVNRGTRVNGKNDTGDDVYKFQTTRYEDGSLFLLCYSLDNVPVPDNDSEIAFLKLNIPANMAAGNYPVVIKAAEMAYGKDNVVVDYFKGRLIIDQK